MIRFMKSNYFRLPGRIAFIMCALFAVSACGEDDPNDPNTPVDDPDGTITVNILNNGRDESVYLNGIEVWIDEANNLCTQSDLLSVGNVAGLGNVNINSENILTAAWQRKAAITPGEGFILYSSPSRLARLYVVGFMESTGGGIMGAQVKYQGFSLPTVPIEISSESTEFTFDKNGGYEEIKLLNQPTDISVHRYGCVRDAGLTNFNTTLYITVDANPYSTTRSGSVILKNDESSVAIYITQLGK